MHSTYLPQRGDGSGFADEGEQFRRVVAHRVKLGWTAAEILDEVRARYWIYSAPPHWDNRRIQQEIEASGAQAPPKPAAKAVAQIADNVLPASLRARIESEEIPDDRDAYLFEIVGALAALGWTASEITIEIAGRPWVPARYAANGSRHLEEFGVKPRMIATLAARADSPTDLPVISRVVAQAGVAPSDVAAADDLRAVQRAIAEGRWRENAQSKSWAGHAVASALRLDVETHKTKIVELLKSWIADGSLVVVEREDAQQRKPKNFIEVGSGSRVTQAAPRPGRRDDNGDQPR